MWGHTNYDTQIMVLVQKFTFKVVLGVIFFPQIIIVFGYLN